MLHVLWLLVGILTGGLWTIQSLTRHHAMMTRTAAGQCWNCGTLIPPAPHGPLCHHCGALLTADPFLDAIGRIGVGWSLTFLIVTPLIIPLLHFFMFWAGLVVAFYYIISLNRTGYLNAANVWMPFRWQEILQAIFLPFRHPGWLVNILEGISLGSLLYFLANLAK